MTITSTPVYPYTMTRAYTSGQPSWTFTPTNRAGVTNPPVVFCHGDPSTLTADQYAPLTILQYDNVTPGYIWGPMMWNLLATGRQTSVQFTGSSWGTGPGQANLAAHIDAVVGPTGMVDLVGQSMGVQGALSWAATHPTRVKSLTLFDGAISLMDQFDVSTGFAQEIALAYTGNAGSSRATTSAACASVDPARNTAAYTSIANRIFVVSSNVDTTVPNGPGKTWATAVGIPTSQQLYTATGSHGQCMWDPAYNDLTILRNIERCALL